MPLPFHTPLLSDRAAVCDAAARAHAMENDAGFAGIWLLREKYATEIALENGVLYRRYSAGIRAGGYGFPLGADDLRSAVLCIRNDADTRNLQLRLTMLTRAQCAALDEAFPGSFRFDPQPDYTEYLYLQENLAMLRGSKYHGKRNHIAQFWRSDPDAQIQPLIAENADFAVEIAERWLAGRLDPKDPSLLSELASIKEAAANWENLALGGLLLYSHGQPIGMTVVSEISPRIWDVHFEKVAPNFPHAWPVVANEMAKCLPQAAYLNREEDLGAGGMRTSKFSYHPDLQNEKYDAVFCGEERIC